MLIRSTADISLADGIKGLVYGNPGMGKTRLLASAPQPCLVLSAEKGLISLKNYAMPYVNITSLLELQQVRQWLLSDRSSYQFPSIGIDSISDIAESLLGTEKLKKNADAHGRAYGIMADMIEAELKAFRDLPSRHVIMIAKLGTATDEFNRRYNAPDFPGKQLVKDAPYVFDFVWQLVREPIPGNAVQAWYKLRCHPDNMNIAKTRNGERFAEWENADPATGGGLSYLFNKMVA